MEIQQNNAVRKISLPAIIGLTAGVVSFLPYLLWIINILLLLATNVFLLWFLIYIPVSFYSWNGIAFGFIGLTIGSIAIGQVKNKQDMGTGHHLAIIGMVLGVLGIISNLLFYAAQYLFSFGD